MEKPQGNVQIAFNQTSILKRTPPPYRPKLEAQEIGKDRESRSILGELKIKQLKLKAYLYLGCRGEKIRGRVPPWMRPWTFQDCNLLSLSSQI